ncbi:hypothetical protein QBC40DRAFT_69602 [Triangularia verruculosa]|uniref:Uncharacterized protein n=1 Tax=Triangularia verruculosa TaxID=2587418 RepID=A0AAN6XH43_9PEZI|nr:hypothetical protein QBC40DRAFT_69602 [Triangularia verruculosa]
MLGEGNSSLGGGHGRILNLFFPLIFSISFDFLSFVSIIKLSTGHTIASFPSSFGALTFIRLYFITPSPSRRRLPTISAERGRIPSSTFLHSFHSPLSLWSLSTFESHTPTTVAPTCDSPPQLSAPEIDPSSLSIRFPTFFSFTTRTLHLSSRVTLLPSLAKFPLVRPAVQSFYSRNWLQAHNCLQGAALTSLGCHPALGLCFPCKGKAPILAAYGCGTCSYVFSSVMSSVPRSRACWCRDFEDGTAYGLIIEAFVWRGFEALESGGSLTWGDWEASGPLFVGAFEAEEAPCSHRGCMLPGGGGTSFLHRRSREKGFPVC